MTIFQPGAALVLLLRDWLSTRTDVWGVVTGAIFIVAVLGFRRGLWVTLTNLPQPLRRWGGARGATADGEQVMRLPLTL